MLTTANCFSIKTMLYRFLLFLSLIAIVLAYSDKEQACRDACDYAAPENIDTCIASCDSNKLSDEISLHNICLDACNYTASDMREPCAKDRCETWKSRKSKPKSALSDEEKETLCSHCTTKCNSAQFKKLCLTTCKANCENELKRKRKCQLCNQTCETSFTEEKKLHACFRACSSTTSCKR